MARSQFDRRRGGRHQDIDDSRLDRRVAVGPRQFGVDLCDDQARPADRGVQVLDAEPGVVPSGIVRPLTCSITMSIGKRPLAMRPGTSEIFAGTTLWAP